MFHFLTDRVFDVSDYTNYHPGGVEELMKGAGQDATNLFNQVSSNYYMNHHE